MDKHVVLASRADVNSAVFNQAKDSIIAGLDKNENGLVCLKADESLEELNTINLSFPDLDESIEIDKYRLFSIERFKNNFIMFAAYYSD